jgi:damage-control phosphatase, subfamily I
MRSFIFALERERDQKALKITLDCISCILRQSFETCEILDLDEAAKETTAREILKTIADLPFDQTTGHITRKLQEVIREVSGVADPYNNIKSFYTDLALRAYPELKETVAESENRFDAAVRMALAGSAIQYVLNGEPDIVTIFNRLESVLTRPIHFDQISELEVAAQNAERILYLADNAGETVFDRILIEELPRDKVTYVVKGAPVVNDATHIDAKFAGLTDVVKVVDNGSDAPGTILELCSPEFVKLFHSADLVISKGQANFKSLAGMDREIFHIFRVKCDVVAASLGCAPNQLVVMNSQTGGEKKGRNKQRSLKATG